MVCRLTVFHSLTELVISTSPLVIMESSPVSFNYENNPVEFLLENPVHDWYQALYKFNNTEVIEGYNNKTKHARTSVKSLYNTFMWSVLEKNYYSVLKSMGMYDCIKYTRLFTSLLVCHVDRMVEPNEDTVISYNDMHVSHWRQMNIKEQQMAHLRSRSGKLRCIIYHSDNIPLFMFVFDKRAHDQARLLLDEEEHYQLISSSSNKRSANISPSSKKMCTSEIKNINTATVSVGTQTYDFERFGNINKRVNIFKSLVGREINGTVNRTDVAISVPSLLQLEILTPIPNDVDYTYYRYTPLLQELSMVKVFKKDSPSPQELYMEKMYKKINPALRELQDLYNCCRLCRCLFYTYSINDICFQCARENNINTLTEYRPVSVKMFEENVDEYKVTFLINMYNRPESLSVHETPTLPIDAVLTNSFA